MKKVFSILLFTTISIAVLAQNTSQVPSINNGHKPGFGIVAEASLKSVDGESYSLNVLGVYKINSYIMFGLGTGLNSFTSYNSESTMLPALTYMRITFINKKISPFLSFKMGYAFDFEDNLKPIGPLYSIDTGVVFRPKTKKMSTHLGVGFDVFEYDAIPYAPIGFILGFSF